MCVGVEGVVEVWLTSEDLGAYGHDIGVTLPQLLWQLVRVIPEDCMLRLGMTNPPYIMDHMEVSRLRGNIGWRWRVLIIPHHNLSLTGDGGHLESPTCLLLPPCPSPEW